MRNYLGESVALGAYRGRAVLVTFLYTHCPDVCPLIASNPRIALVMLGARSSRAQVIAVSVDPGGDTPASVAAFLGARGLAGKTQYLIGSGTELARTWSAWNVGSTREVGHPDLVAHSALVYGISASGKLITVYPARFAPAPTCVGLGSNACRHSDPTPTGAASQCPKPTPQGARQSPIARR